MGVGLYLHIPFCRRKCAYCDFVSFANRESFWLPVVAGMKKEIQFAHGLDVETIYFGGGTPTVLPPALLRELMHEIYKNMNVARDAEISIEANPGTVDADMFSALRAMGFNRLSIGAQAAQDSLLETLGRIHRWPDAEKAVRDAQAAGFENINLDLMYGLPGQKPADFRESLEKALALGVKHLSLYSLIVEENTPFYERYHDHPELLPNEDELAEMDDDAHWMTADAGLERYEISNYAVPGFECRHNLIYWTRRDYLGVGCAAASLMHNCRWTNAATLEGYMRGEKSNLQKIGPDEQRFERLMLGLRLVDGVDWGDQETFNIYEEKLHKLRNEGLCDWDDEHLWLTPRGLDLQNRVLTELME